MRAGPRKSSPGSCRRPSPRPPAQKCELLTLAGFPGALPHGLGLTVFLEQGPAAHARAHPLGHNQITTTTLEYARAVIFVLVQKIASALRKPATFQHVHGPSLVEGHTRHHRALVSQAAPKEKKGRSMLAATATPSAYFSIKRLFPAQPDTTTLLPRCPARIIVCCPSLAGLTCFPLLAGSPPRPTPHLPVLYLSASCLFCREKAISPTMTSVLWRSRLSSACRDAGHVRQSVSLLATQLAASCTPVECPTRTSPLPPAAWAAPPAPHPSPSPAASQTAVPSTPGRAPLCSSPACPHQYCRCCCCRPLPSTTRPLALTLPTARPPACTAGTGTCR